MSRTRDGSGRACSPLDGVTLAVLVATIGLVYGGVMAGLWNDWWHDDNYAHGVLVLPAISWLVWSRWRTLAAIPHKPSAAGAIIVALSLGVFIIGQAAVDFWLTRASLAGVLAGTVVQLLGWRHLQALRLPFLLFALAIPLPSLIFNQLAFPLQLLASHIGVSMLSWVGIPVVREGNVILLQQATLEVAEACSGVRSLISMLTLALMYGSLTGQRLSVRVAIFAAAVPVVILINGMRVAGAGVAAHVYGAGAASGFLHTFSGWIFFGVSIALLLIVERGATMASRFLIAARADRRGAR